LERCGSLSSDDRPTTTALGDWYATALFWRPQVALLVNETTRLPVFVRLGPAATLVERFAVQLGRVVGFHGIDPRFVAAELVEMGEYRFAKTRSRSVLGSMNEFSFLAEVHRDEEPDVDLIVLSMQLSRTPCGPLRDRSGFPDLELQAVAARTLGLV
jgi:Domain of unknown function (DUF6933)